MEKNSKRSKRNIETNHDQLPLCNIATLFFPHILFDLNFPTCFFFPPFIILSMRETSILLKKTFFFYYFFFFFDQNLHIIHLYRNISLLITFFDTVKKYIYVCIFCTTHKLQLEIPNEISRLKILEKRNSGKWNWDRTRASKHDFHDFREFNLPRLLTIHSRKCFPSYVQGARIYRRRN